MDQIQREDLHPATSINISTDFIKVPAKQKFIPKGALAFFVLLIVLCLVIWFGIYFLMLART